VNPDERVPGRSRVLDGPKIPKEVELPSGVERNEKWYAWEHVLRDGRTVYEFYKRASGPVVDGKPQDPVVAVVEGPPNVLQQQEWKKEQEKAEKPPPTPSTRNIKGVPHQVTGKDENGQDIWSPVQTASGPAAAATTPAQAAAPGGKAFIDDGPEAGEHGRRWGWNPDTRLYDRDLGPSPSAQKPPKPSEAGSGAAIKPVEGRPGWRSVTTKATKDGNSVEETYYLDPEGNRRDTLPGQETTATGTKPLEGQPGWQVGTRTTKDAQGNTVAETYYIDPRGNETKTPPAEQGSRKETAVVKGGRSLTEVTEVDPKTKLTRTYYIDPTTRQEVKLPDDPATVAPPTGMPRYVPDLTKPGGGLWDYRDQLDAWIEANPDKMSWTQRQAIMAEASTFADSIANQWNAGATILREDFQSQVSQRNVDVTNAQHRASLANQHVQNAVGLVSKFLPYLGQTPGDAGKLFRGMMAGQLALATSYGGMKDFPREQLPTALREFAERATGGTPTGAPAVGAPVPPNAIPPSVGTAGAVPGAVTPSSEARPLMEVPTTGQALPPPAFRPPPPVPGSETPVSMTGPAPSPQMAALFGQTMPQPRAPEEDSWRQMAMNRRDMLLGQQYAGSALPELPEPVGLDLNASMGPMLAPVLDTRIPGLTPELDFAAKQELESEWFS